MDGIKIYHGEWCNQDTYQKQNKNKERKHAWYVLSDKADNT